MLGRILLLAAGYRRRITVRSIRRGSHARGTKLAGRARPEPQRCWKTDPATDWPQNEPRPYVRIGRAPAREGHSRARAMTMNEAQEAMTVVLQGDAAPKAGVPVMVMRLRGETPEESQGFTAACAPQVKNKIAGKPILTGRPYAAGRSRGVALVPAGGSAGGAGRAYRHFDCPRMEFTPIGHCFGCAKR